VLSSREKSVPQVGKGRKVTPRQFNKGEGDSGLKLYEGDQFTLRGGGKSPKRQGKSLEEQPLETNWLHASSHEGN